MDACQMTLLDFCNYHDSLDLRDELEGLVNAASQESG